ncbi:uncharacterized protein LOC131595829 [Vicia villosa]|uniref:uncharacterized protein LOC131595829 n=1 Tax=Vicia villosa TaxID=3911 RepID=UPI00273BECE8|nr:uncharacterized protein LOC131595829 [Vicia villosa]XP_058724302.1 uncharacterized protein LOC131595829 [Vicia villosa]XP_058724303.1 uncharacterized protein LOC131595829 [Vicia villosa]XP_058724304.1 uncharacterized protein LOC131595829 [Vicia villosa]XP_058724305.1 uncharacterized protein LOC131595829 [Vicia villosa]
MKNIKNPNDIVISFQDFPFFLSDDTKSFMIASSGIHLDASLAEVRNLAPKSLFETPRILLLGPSEFYQEAVSKAIAKHFDARLLIVDLLSFSAFSLWGTTIKEAESSKRNSKKKIRLETHFFEAGSRVSYRNVIGVNVPGEPMNGSTGLVLLNFEDNTRAKVGVKFDKYFQGGNDLRGISKVGHGYFCKALYLHLLETPSEKDDFHNKIMNNTFEFASNQAKRGSLVVLLQNLECRENDMY